MSKVKMKYDGREYKIKSKSLNAALNRAALVVQVIGQTEVEDFDVTNRNKNGEITNTWRVSVKHW